jgi:hypothetical protein
MKAKSHGSGSGRRSASSDNWHECWKRHNELRGVSSLSDFRTFKIDADTYDAVYRNDIGCLSDIREFRAGDLNEANYCNVLKTFLSIDEAHRAIDSRRFDMFGQRLKTTYDNGRKLKSVELVVEGLSQGQPSLVVRDVVVLKSKLDGEYKTSSVEAISGDRISLARQIFEQPEMERFLEMPIDVAFVSNGLVYECYERAIDAVSEDCGIKSRVFASSSDFDRNSMVPAKISVEVGPSELDERLASLNEPQRQAVVGILESKCRPKPYIVFGPPGTGKTHTLVEAITQIYRRDPNAKILFCANSNTCADQTVDKLKKVDVISETDICRVNAGDRVQPNRTYDVRAMAIPLKRIMVTTNVKSCSLMRKYQFDYVFLDEAGHAHEPESLLPICCLKSDGCLVLAGDPKQLGPVIQCVQLEKYHFDRSLFERMFKFKMYERDRASNKYDSSCITKLLDCYRCDPRILAISNKLFYENELICVDSTPKSMLRIMNLSGPLQCCHVRGTQVRPPNSTSWRNEEEAKYCADLIVRLYKMGFEPDQIGLITPYKLQAKFIRKKLEEKLAKVRDLLEKRFERKRLVSKKKRTGSDGAGSVEEIAQNLAKVDLQKKADESGERVSGESESGQVLEAWKRDDRWICKIDTVDAFQGNEREVIIVSTVRTPSGVNSKFIDEPRRFNVTLSRAKWLTFVVGHRSLLMNHLNWSEYVKQAAKDETSRWPRQLSNNVDPFSSRRLFR